jgi:hypothetical protein
VLVSQLPTLGWRGMFFVMAALCFAVMGATFFVNEPGQAMAGGAAPPRLTWRELGQRARRLVDTPAARLVLVLVATYKLGETLADSVFDLWLMKVPGYALHEAAGFAGWGMVGSLLGSAVGGLVATRLRLITAVGVAALCAACRSSACGRWRPG